MMPNLIKKYLILSAKTLIIALILIFGYYWLILRPEAMIWKRLQYNEEILIQQQNYLSQSRIVLVELIKADANQYNYPTYLKNTLEKLQGINIVAHDKSQEKIQSEPILSLGKKHIRAYNRNILSGIHQITEENKIFLKDQKKMLDDLQLLNYNQQKEFLKTNQTVPLLTQHTNLLAKYDYWLAKLTALKRSL